MTKHLFLSGVLALTTALGSAAYAAPNGDVNVLGQRLYEDQTTVQVGFADLDLRAASDRGRLISRVRGAVREVCSPLADTGQRIAHSYCRGFAWNGAKPQLDRAFRQAEIAARTGSASVAAAIVIATPSRF